MSAFSCPPRILEFYGSQQAIENSDKIHTRWSDSVRSLARVSEFLVACALRYAQVFSAKCFCFEEKLALS